MCCRRPILGRIGFALRAFRTRSYELLSRYEMWIQIKDHDEDDQFSDDATYEVHASGLLMVASGNDIRLYSPAGVFPLNEPNRF